MPRALLERVAAASPAHGLSDGIAQLALDVERLLNARQPAPAVDGRPGAGLMGYGVADCGMLVAASAPARHRLGEAIGRALADHEPRLHEIRVTVEAEPAAPGRLAVRIDARLQPRLEPVSLQARAWLAPWRVALGMADPAIADRPAAGALDAPGRTPARATRQRAARGFLE